MLFASREVPGLPSPLRGPRRAKLALEVGEGGGPGRYRPCGPPSPTSRASFARLGPRKGGGSRRTGLAASVFCAALPRRALARRHLRGPAPGEGVRAVGALRAVAAKGIEPDIEIDAVAAKPALGENRGNLGGR